MVIIAKREYCKKKKDLDLETYVAMVELWFLGCIF
jgi:hypothetical protein